MEDLSKSFISMTSDIQSSITLDNSCFKDDMFYSKIKVLLTATESDSGEHEVTYQVEQQDYPQEQPKDKEKEELYQRILGAFQKDDDPLSEDKNQKSSDHVHSDSTQNQAEPSSTSALMVTLFPSDDNPEPMTTSSQNVAIQDNQILPFSLQNEESVIYSDQQFNEKLIEIECMRHENQMKDQELKELKEKLQKQAHSKEDMDKEYEALKIKFLKVEGELSTKNVEIIQLREQVSIKDVLLSRLKIEMEQIMPMIDQDLQKSQTQSEQNGQTIINLHKKIEELQANISSQNEIITQKVRQLEQSSQKIFQLESTLTAKSEQEQYLKQKIQKLFEVNSQLNEEIRTLRYLLEDNYKKLIKEKTGRQIAEKRMVVLKRKADTLSELERQIEDLKRPLNLRGKFGVVQKWFEEERNANGVKMSLEDKVVFMNWCEEYFRIYVETLVRDHDDEVRIDMEEVY